MHLRIDRYFSNLKKDGIEWNSFPLKYLQLKKCTHAWVMSPCPYWMAGATSPSPGELAKLHCSEKKKYVGNEKILLARK